jgi:hypothetical protein
MLQEQLGPNRQTAVMNGMNADDVYHSPVRGGLGAFDLASTPSSPDNRPLLWPNRNAIRSCKV